MTILSGFKEEGESLMAKNIKNNRETEFINYLRLFAVISILLCHYMPESNNIYVKMSAQFLI